MVQATSLNVRLNGEVVKLCVLQQDSRPHTLRELIAAGKEAGFKLCREDKGLPAAIRAERPQDKKADWGECLLIMREQMTSNTTGRWALETVHNDAQQAYTPGFWPVASLDATIPVGFKLVFEC